MARITESGGLETLSAERIWQELAKALATDRPSVLPGAARVRRLAVLMPLLAEAAPGADLLAEPAFASLDLPADEAPVLERYAALLARRRPPPDRGGAASHSTTRPAIAHAPPSDCGHRPSVAMRRWAPHADDALFLSRARPRAICRCARQDGATASVSLSSVAPSSDYSRPRPTGPCGRTRRVLAAVPDALAVDAAAWAAGVPGAEIGERVRAARVAGWATARGNLA